MRVPGRAAAAAGGVRPAAAVGGIPPLFPVGGRGRGANRGPGHLPVPLLQPGPRRGRGVRGVRRGN